MIWNQEVTVNGQVCDDPDAEFDLEQLHYTVKDEACDYREQSYLMMHKPSHTNARTRPNTTRLYTACYRNPWWCVTCNA